jgi:hypothetical protein
MFKNGEIKKDHEFKKLLAQTFSADYKILVNFLI